MFVGEVSKFVGANEMVDVSFRGRTEEGAAAECC